MPTQQVAKVGDILISDIGNFNGQCGGCIFEMMPKRVQGRRFRIIKKNRGSTCNAPGYCHLKETYEKFEYTILFRPTSPTQKITIR